jgi:hypothetical protein
MKKQPETTPVKTLRDAYKVRGFRVLQRRAYGLRDEEYLKLKILTSGLPEL